MNSQVFYNLFKMFYYAKHGHLNQEVYAYQNWTFTNQMEGPVQGLYIRWWEFGDLEEQN